MRSWDLAHVVNELELASRGLGSCGGEAAHRLPSRQALREIMEGLRAALFPAHFGPPDLGPDGRTYFVGHRLDATLRLLQDQITRGLCYAGDVRASDAGSKGTLDPADITRDFALALPEVRRLLGTDIQAAFDGDPAATSLDEVLFCYPGLTAILHHRIAHALLKLGVPMLPRILAELAHAETGVDIHPGASIGPAFFIDHGTGVVIGETCVIGARVRIYQGVTLGAKSFPLDAQGLPVKGIARHPIVEDDVVIYAGATILGRVTIGRGSSIGGNVWLTRSVPPESRISQQQATQSGFDSGGGI